MNDTPALVAFDIDDTLYLERDYVRSGFEAVGRYVEDHWSIGNFAREAWLLFENGLRGKVFDAALERTGAQICQPRIHELIRVYREHEPDIALLPDASDALGALRSRCKIGIISDGPRVSQRRKVEALGLESLTGMIVLTDEFGEQFAKPSLLAYRQLEDWAGAEGKLCAYIGDNPAKDFLGARASNWGTVRVRRPRSLHFHVDAEPGYEPDFEVTDLCDAIRRLGFS